MARVQKTGRPPDTANDISAAKIPDDVPLSARQAARHTPGNRQAYEDAARSEQALEEEPSAETVGAQPEEP